MWKIGAQTAGNKFVQLKLSSQERINSRQLRKDAFKMFS